MSHSANELLSLINSEYDNRLKSGLSKEEAIIFKRSDIDNKFNSNDISELLNELKNFGYIELWITGDFILKVD